MDTIKRCLLELNVYAAVKSKMLKCNEASPEKVSCITEHKGFKDVYRNGCVLQAVYFAYRQWYGTRDVQDQPLHE